MYKCLPAEEKAKWEAHAAQDKARFEAEMSSYVPPPGYDQAGNLVDDHRVMSKKYQKKVKDPQQPKVGISSPLNLRFFNNSQSFSHAYFSAACSRLIRFLHFR